MLGEPLGAVVFWKVEDHGWRHEQLRTISVLITVSSAMPRPLVSSASVVVRVRVTPMRHG